MATTNIEKELIKATGTKKTTGSRQKVLKNLITSALELDGDDWEALTNEAQHFVNAGSRAIEEKEDVPEPNDDFDSEEKYFEGTAEENTDADDNTEVDDGDSDGDSDDTDDVDGEADNDSGTDGEEEGASEDDTPDEDEEEVKPKRGRKAAAKKDDEEDDEKPKKKAAAKKTEPKAAKEKSATKAKEPAAKKPTGPKPVGDGAQAWIKRLVIEDPNRTMEQITHLLAKKGKERGFTPSTTLATSTIRSGMLQTLRILKAMGKLKGVQI